MYKYNEKPNTSLSITANNLITDILNHSYIVLCGRNNCGKSYILKLMREKYGEKSSFLGPARYQNFNMLSAFSPNQDRKKQEWANWLRQHQVNTENLDNSPFNLQQAIAELNDDQRKSVTEIMEKLLGAKMEILHTIADNSMSQQYISVNGHNISFASSGYRLIASLVTSLLDKDYETFLIDEPELGISPEAQGVFSDFLFNEDMRKKYFPHIKTLVLATHSTVFLDRKNIHNNFFVSKVGDVIDIKQSVSVSDVNTIHFFLLGNRLESLYMPSVMVIVEGKCDHTYIERVLQTKYQNIRFSIIAANSDTRIKEVFNTIKTLFGDIQKSPYHNRIFAVIDSIHGKGLPQQLEEMGLPKDNIIVWKKNGIEYYYPKSIIQNIFHSNDEIVIEGDLIKSNGAQYKKTDLLNAVIPLITKDTVYVDEFHNEFLIKIEDKIS